MAIHSAIISLACKFNAGMNRLGIALSILFLFNIDMSYILHRIDEIWMEINAYLIRMFLLMFKCNMYQLKPLHLPIHVCRDYNHNRIGVYVKIGHSKIWNKVESGYFYHQYIQEVWWKKGLERFFNSKCTLTLSIAICIHGRVNIGIR